MKVTRLSICLLFLLTFCAAEARADTLVVTGGSVLITKIGGDGNASFNLLGSNFTYSSGVAPFVPTPGCGVCQPGTVLSSNFFTAGINQIAFTINGSSYNTTTHSISNSITLLGPNYVVAETVTLPFTFTGLVTVFSLSTGQVLESHTFVGQGFVTIEHSFIDFGGGISRFEFRRATYNFTNVPEPGTLLLLATGLAGAGGAALRRRRALKGISS